MYQQFQPGAQWYLPDNVSVEGGVLRLKARRDQVRGSDGASYPYTSGMVTTGRSEDDQAQQPRFGFRYGRVEVRMRMPEGKGLWSPCGCSRSRTTPGRRST